MEITIIVELEAAPAAAGTLAALLCEHARRTLEEEPGCLRFDALQALDAAGAPLPGRHVAVAVFSGALALRAHEENPRRARFEAALAPLLASRRQVCARALAPHAAEPGIRPEDLTAANDD